MTKIWQKTNPKKSHAKGGHSAENLITLVEKFTVANDHELDQQLVPYDIQGSKAHAEGLEKIGILSAKELAQLQTAFDEVLSDWEQGSFIVKREHEDSHTAIESALVAKLGNLGKKIHTGRSRNDQVLVMMRLFTRDFLNKIIDQVKISAEKFLDFAEKHEFVPMPGYTHTQLAMPASLGMWAGAIAEMLLMNLELLTAVKKNVNLCPLGTAAGFGVAFDLPRDFVAEQLGFDSPMIVSLTAQNSRGKIEADVLSSLVSLGSTLAHFANDVVLFTSQEFDFFRLPDELTTGSSIMPQKKNIDPAELLRARYSQLLGYEMTLRDLTKGLISGYHRDLQLSKEPLVRGLQSSLEMLEIAQALIENLEPKTENLRAKFSHAKGGHGAEIFAADAANELVKSGMSFRDAYVEVGKNLDQVDSVDIDQNLRSKTHLGATGNLGLERLREKLENL